MPEVHAGRDGAIASGCAAVFALPFLIAGAIIVWQGIIALRHHQDEGVVILIVGVLFTAMSLAIVAISFHGVRQWSERNHRRAQSPSQPWMWLWVFAIAWNAITIPLTIAVFRLMMSRPPLAFLVVLFPLIGVALLCGALYLSLRAWKFGKSTCTIDALPIAVGDSFHADVEHRGDVSPEGGYRVVLSAINRIIQGAGKSRRITENVLWQSEQRVSSALAAPTPIGRRIPIDFSIPIEQPSTDQRDQTNATLWRMEVSAELPGIDYKASFELPVFVTAEGHAAEAVAAYQVAHRAEAASRSLAASSAVTATPLPDGGTEFRIAPAREFGSLVTMVIVMLVWFGAVALMFRLGAPLPIAAIFSLFGLVFLIVVIDAVAGRSIVTADPRLVRARREWLGIGTRVDIEPAKIDSVRSKLGARSGRKQYYEVEARLTDNSTRTLARYLRSSDDAEVLAAKIWYAVGRR